MEQTNEFNVKEWAMRIGLLAGGLWAVSFLLCAYAFPSDLNPDRMSISMSIGMLISMPLGLASLPLVGFKLRGARNQTVGMTMLRTWGLAFLTFMCATLITTVVQYVYFAYLDHGSFIERMLAVYNTKEMSDLAVQMYGQEMWDTMKASMSQLQTTPTKWLVMSFLQMNFFIGLIFSAFSILFTIGAGRRREKGEF